MADERTLADARLADQKAYSEAQLATERAAADARLREELAHADARLAKERQAAREAEQVTETWAVQLAAGRIPAPNAVSTRRTPSERPIVIIVNHRRYTITRIEAKFSDGTTFLGSTRPTLASKVFPRRYGVISPSRSSRPTKAWWFLAAPCGSSATRWQPVIWTRSIRSSDGRTGGERPGNTSAALSGR